MVALYVGHTYVIESTSNITLADMAEIHLDENQLCDLRGKVAIVTGTQSWRL